MKLKRIAALALALAMGTGTLGLGAYAEVAQPVAEQVATAETAVEPTEPTPEAEPAELPKAAAVEPTEQEPAKAAEASDIVTEETVAFSAGSGTEASPYQISSADDLQRLATIVNNGTASAPSATLTQDIDLSSVCHAETSVGKSDAVNWVPIGTETKPYKGVFDGGNHTISGLYYNDGSVDYVGLFGVVGEGGEVKNLTVADSDIVGGEKTLIGGAICGVNNGGTIRNCTNKGSVSGLMIAGGICGQNSTSSNAVSVIEGCTNSASVYGQSNIGGVCGLNMVMTSGVSISGISAIRNCINTGAITNNTVSEYVSGTGGVVGGNQAGNGGTATITGCFSTGAINVSVESTLIGGVAGCSVIDSENSGSTATIDNCYYDSSKYTGTGVGTYDSVINVASTNTEAKPTAAFTTGEVAWLLNTTDGTAANSKTWAQGTAAPQLAKADKSDAIYRALFLPETGDTPVAATLYLKPGAALTAPAGHTWVDVPATMPAADTTYRWTTAAPVPPAATTDAAGFVERLYSVGLGRSTDATGNSYWTDQLENYQISGTKSAYGFVFSKEFQNKKYSNEDYVEQLYAALMGRKSDATGKAYWVSRLDAGASREEVFYGFADSNEFNSLCNSYGIVAKDIETFVTRFYKVCLNRAPDAGGLADWSSRLRGKTSTGRDVGYGFVFSKEFQSKKYSNEDYVEHLYASFLGRTSDATGKAYWVSRLKSGASREEVFDGFVVSKEFGEICAGFGIVRG